MFSMKAKPAPTAKPQIAASTMNPILLLLIRYMMGTAFRSSSSNGATYLE